ncbi:MAG: PAS domain-containing protein, partial [Bacteroidetes bacterium]|nr:PAS domain-containing protein [Bacteroidota bacterium]
MKRKIVRHTNTMAAYPKNSSTVNNPPAEAGKNVMRSSFKISGALKLAVIYLLFGSIWILSTDWIVVKLFGESHEMIRKIMSLKGLLFIGLSGLLIYFLERRLTKNLDKTIEEKNDLLKRYNALNEASKEAIYEYDLINGSVTINGHLKDMMGFTENYMTGGWDLWKQKVHPDDYKRIKQGLYNQLETGETIWQDEYKMKDINGVYRDVIHCCYLIKDESGKPYHVLGTLQDITELRNLQKRIYEERLNSKSILISSIIKAQENERNRWAQELHDNIGQLLTVTKLYMDELSSEKLPDKALLDKTKGLVYQSINEIRQLSSALKPPVFSDITLGEAIESLVLNIKRVKEIDFSLEMLHLKEDELNEELKLMVYRIIQEQFSNILKYANAKTVSVKV